MDFWVSVFCLAYSWNLEFGIKGIATILDFSKEDSTGITIVFMKYLAGYNYLQLMGRDKVRVHFITNVK
jgi:hypothetical protein